MKRTFWIRLFMSLVISSLSFLIASPSFAHDEEINGLTTQILQGNAIYHRAPAAEKSKMLEKILGLAANRKALMLGKIKSDSGTFLLHALPSKVRDSLPAEVQSLIERQIEVSGELTVTWADDIRHGRSETLYELVTDETSKHKFNLHFVGDPTSLMSGSKIKVKGVALDSEIGLAAGGGPSVKTLSAASTSTAAVQQAIVLVGNFLDSAVPCTTADIHARMFTNSDSIHNYYQETSFGQASFSGDTYGPYTINYSSSSTDYTGWANALDQAATATGVNLANYNRKVYVLTPNGTRYSGYGLYGGNPSRAWIYHCDWPDLYAHELGHNFGLQHASTPSSEYGDFSCVMGYSQVGLRQLNAPHKVQTNWVPSSRVQTVTSSGTYQLSLLEQTNGSSIQVIKIPKTDTNEYYYLGYRSPVGFDATGLSTSYGDYRDTTDVHSCCGSSGNTNLLGVLRDGSSFNDPINGVSILQTGHDATAGTATLSITTTGAPCTSNAPTVAVSPLSGSGGAGTSLTYNLSLTNQDSSVCGNVTFSLAASVLPSGWLSTFSPSSLQIAPGASGTSTWTIDIPAGVPDGSYPIQATIADVANVGHGTFADATVVALTDSSPPTVSMTSPLDGSSILSNGQVKISVSASDNIGITKVEVRIDGALKATLSSMPYATTWNGKRAAKGPHTIQATAYDAAGNNASASVTVVR